MGITSGVGVSVPDRKGTAADVAGFTTVLRRILVEEKHGGINRVAAALGLAPRTFYARLHNQSRFDPNEVAILLREIKDARLAEWLFSRSSLVVVNRPAEYRDGAAGEMMQRALACAAVSANTLLALVDQIEHPSLASNTAVSVQVRQAQSAVLWIKLALGSPRQRTRPPSQPRFSALVRQVLLIKRDIPLGDVAARMGMSYSSLYDRMTGRVPFDPVDLRKLFEIYPEPDIADCLLADTPYIAIRVPAWERFDQDQSPLRAGLLALQHVLQLLDLLRKSDGVACVDEATLNRSLDGALEYLAMLHWSTTYIGRLHPANAARSAEGSTASPGGREDAMANADARYGSRARKQARA